MTHVTCQILATARGEDPLLTTMSEGIIRVFVDKQRELLGLEFEADSSPEESKSLEERASHVLASLEVSDVSMDEQWYNCRPS